MLIVSLFSFFLLSRAGGMDGGVPAQTWTALLCTGVGGPVINPVRCTLRCGSLCWYERSDVLLEVPASIPAEKW